MRRFAPIAAAVVALALAAAAAPAQALVPADVSLSVGSTSSVVSVSPDVYYDERTSTYYLFTTGMRIGVYSSSDGEVWSEVPGAVTPTGPYSDPSVVKMPDGTYRMYYAYRSGMGPQPCSGKQLKYTTSTDLIRWTAQSPVLLDDLGCGVPNVIDTGLEYRLYYVRGGAGLEHGTYMATSPDGLTWTPTNKLLTPKDFVDPSVVRVADGSWLMFTADFSAVQPPPPGFVQRLYVGTSQDGITWDFDADAPVYSAPAGQGAFDPDAVVLPDGSVRAWWSQGTSTESARVTWGRVTVTEPLPAKPGKPAVKVGKTGIKVTWTYPVGAPAPEGYLVQVLGGSGWTDVAEVTATSASLTWAKVGVKKGATFRVRVVARIGAAYMQSDSTKATRPR